MKNKKLLIGAGVIAVSVAVGSIYVFAFHKDSTQDETLNMINKGEQIEIEVAEPNFTEQGEESEITWVQLGSNMEDESFRKAFELILGIENVDGIKNGIAYINLDGEVEQNNTLYNAFMNKSFVDNYWNNEEVQQSVALAVAEHYADVEADSSSAKYTALCTYWSLLPDYEPNFANMGASLTRGEAMTLLMRATTKVTADGKPVSNEKFTSAVGESDYTDYASYLDSKAFINTSDKSLNNQTFNGTMTKGEFIYLLINNTFGEDSINNVETGDTKLNDCKDGGSKIDVQKFGDGDYSTSYKLVYALQNPDLGAPTPIYKALVKAKQLDIISAETAWDDALTREDAVELFVETMLAYSNVNGSKVEAENGAENSEESALEAEAKKAYKELKDSIILDEKGFISTYKDLVKNQGRSKDGAIEEIKVLYTKEIGKEENKQEPQKEEPKQEENKTLTLKEAWYLEPSGSYTEKELQVDADIKEITGIDKAVRRTYENGAIRDFIIVSGKESALTVPWGADPAEYSSGVGGVSVEVGTTTNTNKQDTNKQNQNTDKKVVYKGIVPPRSKYSSDAEWKKAADKALSSYTVRDGSFFSSEADAKLFYKLCQGGKFTGDLDFANMDGEEWEQWCKENGFTVK